MFPYRLKAELQTPTAPQVELARGRDDAGGIQPNGTARPILSCLMTNRPSFPMLSLARAAALLIALAVGSAATPLTSDDVRPLIPQTPIEQTLAGGQTHRYSIKLGAGEFVRVLVEQRAANIVLVLTDPAEKKIAQIDNRQTERGTESVSFVAPAAGIYVIDVRSGDQQAPPGRYEIRIDQLFVATEREQKLAAADLIIAAGNELFTQHTKVSIAEAVEKYAQALSLVEVAGDWDSKAMVLNKLGRCSFATGDYQKAADYHVKALELIRSRGDRYAEAVTLMNLGEAHRFLPETQQAIDYLNRSLQLWQLIEDRRGEAEALHLLGRVYYDQRLVHKSLVYSDQALELARTLSDGGAEMSILGGMAMSYYILGEFEKAAELWKRTLALARELHRSGMETVYLSKLGSASDALGDKEGALRYLDQAIQRARARGDIPEEAGALQTKGRVYRSIGEPRKAIEQLDQSLVLLKGIDSPAGVARAHYNLGKIYTDIGEYVKAIDYLNRALTVWKAKADTINIAATIRELARAERGRGNLEAALGQSEVALNLMEWVRSQAGGPELRASYLAIVQDCFELQIDVLMRLQQRDQTKNYAAAALRTGERSRARSLLETLAEAGVDLRRGVSPDLVKREQILVEELSARATEQARIRSVQGDSTVMDQQIKDLITKHETVEAEIRFASPAYAELAQAGPIGLDEIQRRALDDGTLLLEYYLGQERSYLWAVTTTSIESYELPARSVIETATRQVYELLTARNRRLKFETAEERRARVARADAAFTPAAEALTKIILGPVADRLANKKLLVVSDGALQYVPFAALPAPNTSNAEPLGLSHEIVSLPSASTLALLRQQLAGRKPAAKTAAVLADPVFDNEDARVKASLARLQNQRGEPALAVNKRGGNVLRDELQRLASESGWEGEALNTSRLPFTRKEADAITALVPATERMQQLDFDASLRTARSEALSQYRIVHFATHGFLNSRHPELSGIVLSLVDENGREQDGFLRAQEIYKLKLPAELVVLSGCRTGLGKEIRGEGLMGVTRAFMHAGAARVLVSLWDVHDEATAELMAQFYRRLLGPDKLSPAAALREAQLSMARDKRWAAPYFWAGFTLQGEPR